MAADPNMSEEAKRELNRLRRDRAKEGPPGFIERATNTLKRNATTALDVTRNAFAGATPGRAMSALAQSVQGDGTASENFRRNGGLVGAVGRQWETTRDAAYGLGNAVSPYIFGGDPAAASTPAVNPYVVQPREKGQNLPPVVSQQTQAEADAARAADAGVPSLAENNPFNDTGVDGTALGGFTTGGPGDDLTQTNANGLRRTAYMRTMVKGPDGNMVPTYNQVAFGTEGSTPVEYDPAAEKARADAHREEFAKNSAVFARDPATGEMRFQGSRAQVGAGAGALTPAQVIAAMQRAEGLDLRRQQLGVMQENAARDDKRANETATTKFEETLLKRAAEDPKAYIQDFEAQVAQLPEDEKLAAFDTPQGRAALRAISANLAPKGQRAAGWMTNTLDEEGDFYDNLANYSVDDGGTYVNEPGSTILGSSGRVDGLFGSNVSGIEKLAIEYARSRNNNLYRE